MRRIFRSFVNAGIAFITCITYLSQSCFCNHCFRYSINTWWECSIDPFKVCCSFICRYFILICYMITYHASYKILICNAIYGLINFSTNASAISDDVLILEWPAFGYQERSYDIHCYFIEGGTRRIPYHRLSTIDCQLRTSFINWQFRHFCVYYCIFNFIADQK